MADIAPDVTVVHRSSGGGVGTGPISYSSTTASEKKRAIVKDKLVADGTSYYSDKDVDFMFENEKTDEQRNRDKFVIDKVFANDIPHWKGAEDILQKRMNTIRETAKQQLMDAKIFYQGGHGETPSEFDRLFMLHTGEAVQSINPVHVYPE